MSESADSRHDAALTGVRPSRCGKPVPLTDVRNLLTWRLGLRVLPPGEKGALRVPRAL